MDQSTDQTIRDSRLMDDSGDQPTWENRLTDHSGWTMRPIGDDTDMKTHAAGEP